jgi:NADPH:quinone reductase-like Zn-dependent oxidoreductase
MKLMIFGSAKGDGQRFMGFYASVNQPDMQQLANWMAEGRLISPIDRSFPLSQTADAIRYMEARRVKGKIVISVA